jgi:TolA-binding protein
LVLRNDSTGRAESLLRDYLNRAPTRSGYPRRWDAHEWLGRWYENQGKTGAAIDEYQAVLKLDPKRKSANESLKRLKKE